MSAAETAWAVKFWVPHPGEWLWLGWSYNSPLDQWPARALMTEGLARERMAYLDKAVLVRVSCKPKASAETEGCVHCDDQYVKGRREALDEARRAVASRVYMYRDGSLEGRIVESCLAELDALRGPT